MTCIQADNALGTTAAGVKKEAGKEDMESMDGAKESRNSVSKTKNITLVGVLIIL